MPKASLTAIVKFCDNALQPDSFKDWDGAVNGLQVENNGTVTKIAATVDASLATIKLAIEAKADLMIVGSSRVDLQACKLEYSIVSPK